MTTIAAAGLRIRRFVLSPTAFIPTASMPQWPTSSSFAGGTCTSAAGEDDEAEEALADLCASS